MNNFLSALPDATESEVFTELLSRPELRIERIVSEGQCSAPDFYYDQDEAEWVLLLQGRAVLELEINETLKTVELEPGSYINIPAHCRHRVKSTAADEKTVWLAIFYGGQNA